MQLQIALLVAVCLAYVVVAHPHDDDDDGHKHHHHHGPHGHPHGPPPSKFPGCKEFEDKVHQELKAMHDAGETGPDKCESGDHDACRLKELMDAKQKSGAVASDECWQQAEAFYKP